MPPERLAGWPLTVAHSHAGGCLWLLGDGRVGEANDGSVCSCFSGVAVLGQANIHVGVGFPPSQDPEDPGTGHGSVSPHPVQATQCHFPAS